MTKREESLGKVILVGLVSIGISVVWELHASDRVQASQIQALESVVPTMGAEVTQIRVILEAEEISRKHMQNGAVHGH